MAGHVGPRASSMVREAIGELIDRVERTVSEGYGSGYVDEQMRELLVDELLAKIARIVHDEDEISWTA